MTNSFLAIAALIVTSAFFSVSEIALAASRKLKLQQLAEAGSEQASKVIALQEQPGHFFTVVQIEQTNLLHQMFVKRKSCRKRNIFAFIIRI